MTFFGEPPPSNFLEDGIQLDFRELTPLQLGRLSRMASPLLGSAGLAGCQFV
jgi:hypothetical protein